MSRTFGVEIEFVTSTRREIQGKIPERFSLVSDGSVRNYSTPVGQNGLFFFEGQSEIECGGEIVSPPLEISEIGVFRDVFKLLAAEMLEVAHATTSTHIHVYAGDLSHQEKLTLFFKALEWESFFFNVSVPWGQEKHRGVENDFIYCRPLTSPPYTQWAGSENKSSSYGNMNMANTPERMWYALGNWRARRNKWHPPRYVGINFCSLFERNTVEFRMFNSTTNFKLFHSWVSLCLGFVESRGEGAPENWAGKYYRYLEKAYRNIFSKIDLSPVMCHLGTAISWEPGNPLNPELYTGKIRQVAEPRPAKVAVEDVGKETFVLRRI